MRLGIISAMQIELDGIKQQMDDITITTISGIDFISGTLHGTDVVAAVSGIGKVFAAICTQTMILKFGVDMLVNVGVAGTLCKDLHIKDIAIASDVVQHDMDTSPLGDPVGLISGINKVKLPCDSSMVDLMERSVSSLGYNYKIGTLASGDQFIHESSTKEYINSTFQAIAAEMEGASVGHVCHVNNIPFVILRSISDGEGAQMDYNEFVVEAAETSISVISEFVRLINDL